MKNIKNWYQDNYPDDKLGHAINPDATFKDLEQNIPNVYDFIGVGDSIIRERIFVELARIKKVEYDDIYYKWLYF